MNEDLPESLPHNPTPWKIYLRNTAYIVGTLFIFLLALDMMISSLQHLGANAADTILLATSNPFTALFIGLLVTAIIQSSSATTSMVVALVASGSITIQAAVPIIMGANVGTTITSTIVSLGFITRKKEFRRAVAAGTYHDFFNILTVLILFPLEYYYGFLSGISQAIANTFFHQPVARVGEVSFLGSGLGGLISQVVGWIDNGLVLILLSFALLFGSILLFRRVLSGILGLGTQDRVQRFFFKSPLQSFGWGLVITAAIRSSTITTSLVVPLVAKKVVRLKGVVPFILGANIGTTITAFIAAISNSNIAISIAIAHFLFNFIGVLLFTFIPYVNSVPVRLAKGLGRLTMRYRLAGFVYILLTFFFIPFSLIYLNKDAVKVMELTYLRTGVGGVKEEKVISKTFRNQTLSSWSIYDEASSAPQTPNQMIGVYRRLNLLMINNELFEFGKLNSCRDGVDRTGAYKMCTVQILPHLDLGGGIEADSVYVFEKKYTDSTSNTIYISAEKNLIMKEERVDNSKRVLELRMLTGVKGD